MFILHEANIPRDQNICITRGLDISGHVVQHVDLRTHQDGHQTVDLIHQYQTVCLCNTFNRFIYTVQFFWYRFFVP